MAPTKDNDTTHLDQFSAEELEDILVQLCDAEGVKVSADDDKALKNLGKNAMDNAGLGGLGKKIFGGGKKKEEQPPESPDGTAPAEPEPAAPGPPAARPASDVIRELNLGDKQGLIGVLQNVMASALSGELDGSSAGGNPLFACFGKLLKGGGSKSRNAIQTSSTQGEETQADGATSSGTTAPAVPSMEDLKTPDALFKYITGHPAVKTMLISGVQTFLAKALQNAQAGKA